MFRFVPLLALLLSSVANLQAEIGSRSRFKVDADSYNFGIVSEGTKVEHQFDVTNLGDADLLIHKTVAACGCTSSVSTDGPIPPGGKGFIKVAFDTTGFEGAKTKEVRVFTNDAEKPTVVLSVVGKVEPEVLIEPRTIDFADVVKSGIGETGPRRVKVSVRPGANVTLGTLGSLSPFVSVIEVSGAQDAKAKEFDVSLLPSTPLGDFRDRLVLNVGGSSSRTLNVPVTAVVTGSVRLTPRMLSFGIVEGADPLLRQLKVEVLGKSTVDIRKILPSDDSITVVKKVIAPGKIYVLDVRVNPALVKKDLKGALEIETDDQEQGQLTVGVFGILPPKS